MNVIHIAETVKGGVATVINSLTENNQIKSHVICPENQSKEIYNLQKTLFSRTGRNISSLSSLLLVIIKTLKHNDFDVIHLHSSFAGFIVRILLLLKVLNKRKYKVVYTPHCFSFIMDTKHWKKQIYIFIERILSKQTDCIIANSNYEYKCAVEAGIKKEQIKVIYNAVSLDGQVISDNVKKLKERMTWQDKINILFVGRFDRQKGYDHLLNVIKKADSSKYVFNVIGDSVHDVIEKVEKENVIYYGWVDNKELPAYFCANDVLLMPSRWESFGLVAVEAQLYGLPVIANNVASLPEVISDGLTGMLVNFEDTNKVVELLDSHTVSFWHEKKEVCRRFASSKFKKSDMVNSYVRVYENC